MTREEAIKILSECKEKGFKHTFYTLDEYHTAMDIAINSLKIDEQYDLAMEQAETVSLKVYEQVMWERDIAIGQLKELGYGFGQKIEPCDDAISRDMALEKMADYVASGYADSVEDFEEYSRIICQLPLVTQNPDISKYRKEAKRWKNKWLKSQKSGKWEHGKEISREYRGQIPVNINYLDWHCSNCHCVVEQSIKPEWNYCPACGAKMESEDKE